MDGNSMKNSRHVVVGGGTPPRELDMSWENAVVIIASGLFAWAFVDVFFRRN